MNWLGETRQGMVGKMNVAQICRLLSAVDTVRIDTSAFINWPLVLEKTGVCSTWHILYKMT